MGIFEKNLIVMIVRFIFRWLSSNEKNRIAKHQKAVKESEEP